MNTASTTKIPTASKTREAPTIPRTVFTKTLGNCIKKPPSAPFLAGNAKSNLMANIATFQMHSPRMSNIATLATAIQGRLFSQDDDALFFVVLEVVIVVALVTLLVGGDNVLLVSVSSLNIITVVAGSFKVDGSLTFDGLCSARSPSPTLAG